jgi:nicotinate-nucleotide pyrophosphorylase (carboxylating)
VIPQAELDRIIDGALGEDLGGGDLTTEATVDRGVRGRALAVARHDLVVCGGAVFLRVFERVEARVVTEQRIPDGSRAKSGDVLFAVEGEAAVLLAGERTALNFAQRLSGIATLARAFVDAVPEGSKTVIADTRKTTPGLRALERYAVRTGGARNHRNDLASAVLIKDNHIAASGGIERAIARARAHAPHTSRIEIEVQSLDELDVALRAGADVILLDNFDVDALEIAVGLVRGRAILEASGGVTLDTVPAIAATGVDVISVGALTHSVKAADIGLDLELVP